MNLTPSMENSTSGRSTWRIVKNVVVISFAFMLHFTAYSGAVNLQSSINAEAGLGTASLTAVYAGLLFSNLFLPVPVIKWIGSKWTISLSFVTYMPYIAAQVWPSFYTMIPAGLILGLGAGPLWCAQGTYLTVASEAHNKISGISAEALLMRFLGVFFMIFQLNQIWGNIISSMLLSSGGNEAAWTALNATEIPELCGANFLPSADAGKALRKQPLGNIQMIAGIYLACMAGAAVLVAVGVDSIKRSNSDDLGPSSGVSRMLGATLRLLLEPYQLMLIPISIFAGFEAAFFGSDFTAAFVSCAIGMGSVGFVMITHGLSSIISCIVTGYLAKVTGRLALICVATIIHGILMVTLLAWRPQANLGYPLYIIAAAWGFCDSIWMIQIKAFYAVVFNGREEAAFANLGLLEAIGFMLAYVVSPYLRTSSKIYILLALMVVGASLYFIVEYHNRKQKNRIEKKNNELYCIKEGNDNLSFNIDSK